MYAKPREQLYETASKELKVAAMTLRRKYTPPLPIPRAPYIGPLMKPYEG
jgi:hypothetical protein